MSDDQGSTAVGTRLHALEDQASTRAIVLFADGTGNAFAKQESNIWRLYDALDTDSPTQIALYVPGVGTSGFKPWAILDGVTGFGVPANIRRLYEFLCWNYQPNDEIYVFGFSRGAFTIRALIGMIDSEGLLSNQGQHGIASRSEMRRNVMSAWRAYRATRRRSFLSEAPTITLTRWIRNALLFVRDTALRYERYATIRSRSDHAVRIRFAGLFDTVEAYGVPLEEMRDAIDWAVWPITFHNRAMSAKVEMARHALSLDDERQTFHPVRISRDTPADRTSDRIKEVWFAGAHSDVGGGYPDDGNALVALTWMLDELGGALTFKPASLGAMRSGASSLDATHDSRKGLSIFYRYFPRVIGSSPADGGDPVIHHSVIEKMVFGPHRYAPHALPAAAQVLMPNGDYRSIQGLAATRSRPSFLRPAMLPTPEALADHAVAALHRPDQFYADAVHDGMWLRRKAYFLLLTGVLVFASLPVTAPLFGVISNSTHGEVLTAGNLVEDSNDVLRSWISDLAPGIGQIIPVYTQPWVNVVEQQPLLSSVILLVTFLMYLLNGRLRDTINDDARCAWFGSGRFGQNRPSRGPLMSLAALLRRRGPVAGRRGLFYPLWFAVTLLGLGVAAFLYVDRVGLSYSIGAGRICSLNKTQVVRPVPFGTPQVAEGFATSNPCWDSGLFLAKGAAYRLTMEMATTFMDRSIIVDIGGFEERSLRQWLAAPLKRWISAPYFKPVARIGSKGMTEWLLDPVSGEQPRPSTTKTPGPAPDDVCAPFTEAKPGDVETLARTLDTQRVLTSRFTAPDSGELFLYVNDAMFGNDLLARALGFKDADCFYHNNSGSAKITVERLGTELQ